MAKALTLDPAVMRRLRELPKTERADCLLALCDLAGVFGQPHSHSGLAIRKLGNKLFECRAGLALRFILQDRPTDLFVSFLGNHDEVRALLKSGKYR
ncbi:hypothetical protein SBA6_1100034 [Candidatus Sulfopaludibacter sp. SbA6]|nr:hypothetical protein SBA6_1100034 [Candidatus Sulfopaludibacter sp. SbA6]